MSKHKLYRSRTDRRVAGVLGGIAEYFGLDSTLVRVGFIIFSLLPGPGLIFYFLAWIVMPEEPADQVLKN